MKVYDIINRLIKTSGTPFGTPDTSYLEIGVCAGGTLYMVEATVKIGTDPFIKVTRECVIDSIIKAKGAGIWEIILPYTSDDFFDIDHKGILPTQYNLIYIDGLHEYKQVLKDIKNGMKVLKDKGHILVHDVNPQTEKETMDVGESTDLEIWCGDVWRAIVEIKNRELDFCTISDINRGLTIIPKQTICDFEEHEHFSENIDYDYFDRNRARILNLMSMEEWDKQLA